MDPNLKNEYRQVRFRCTTPSLPRRFFIITAHNPDGATVDRQANQAANRTLETEIEQAGHHHFPVTGGSPDFTHAEPGFGVTCTDEEALRLARQFRQEAVFKVEDGRVFLISALDTNAAPEEIGSWNDLILP